MATAKNNVKRPAKITQQITNDYVVIDADSTLHVINISTTPGASEFSRLAGGALAPIFKALAEAGFFLNNTDEIANAQGLGFVQYTWHRTKKDGELTKESRVREI